MYFINLKYIKCYMSVKKLLNKYHFSYENNFLSKKKKHRFQINN